MPHTPAGAAQREDSGAQRRLLELAPRASPRCALLGSAGTPESAAPVVRFVDLANVRVALRFGVSGGSNATSYPNASAGPLHFVSFFITSLTDEDG